MAKPEWGIKRICPNCGSRYYDLRKDPPVCPTCGTQFDPEALLKSRRARPVPVDDTKKPLLDDEAAEGDAEELDEAAGDEADAVADDVEVAEDAGVDEDVLLEDASELDDESEIEDVGDIEGDGEEEH